ncbi:MAG: MerR family transcriptional regulator [Thermoleophilia bacterium]|nr:MerR family transcriptional regulator [Thermoleophilia bacterium]
MGHQSLHSIGYVAALLGLHPQTLREYERQGLVTPQRTPGGTRRYGRAELERLEHIQRLTAEGMSLAGVRYVLRIEDELRAARARIAQLEGRTTDSTHHATQGASGNRSVVRSMSLELVHVPRPPRSPRWRNQG